MLVPLSMTGSFFLCFPLVLVEGPKLFILFQLFSSWWCSGDMISGQVSLTERERSKLIPSYMEISRKKIFVSWIPPLENTFKVNVDVSHRQEKSTTCGGLVRNPSGTLLKGFYCNLGSRNTVVAKLWGLWLGIKLARDLFLSSVIFELDSQVMVNMVHKGSTSIDPLMSLLESILSFLCLPNWSTFVVNTYQKANQCANFQANLGHASSLQWSLVDKAPPMLGLLLRNDVVGCSTPHLLL